MTQTARSNSSSFDGEEILAGIRRWVEIETPSHDAAAVNRLVEVVESQFVRLGARTIRTPGRDGYGDILEVHASWNRDQERGILILGHLDTVHSIGSLATTHVFRREGDQVFGPGIYDMKAGSYMAYYALQHFVRQGRTTPLPVRRGALQPGSLRRCSQGQDHGQSGPRPCFDLACGAQQSFNADAHAPLHSDECHSKKFENHCHMVALYTVWYNFARINSAVRMSPAMAAACRNSFGRWAISSL